MFRVIIILSPDHIWGTTRKTLSGFPSYTSELFGTMSHVGSGKSRMKGDKMTPYIANLTKNLIGKHNLRDLYHKRYRPYESSRENFINTLALLLEITDIRDMRGETLGRILYSFEVGDVMASKEELLGAVGFCGDPAETLRQLVSVCLAHLIHDQLYPKMKESGILRDKSVP